MTVFLCEDSLEGILTGVYDAWASRLGYKNVELALKADYNYSLFSQCREVRPDGEKAEKVLRSVKGRISPEAADWVCRAAMSFEPGKADAIYRFLVGGFQIGPGVTGCLQLPEVHAVFRLSRAVGDEAHLLTEFLRFSEFSGSVLFSAIGPRNDVTALLMPHFADRLREDRFIIFDERRGKAGVHRGRGQWYLVSGEAAAPLAQIKDQTDRGEYAGLWRAFFDAVAIRERKNPACQRTHLPLRYRRYMTEFQK